MAGHADSLHNRRTQMTATVYFIDFKANSRENLPAKLDRLVETAGINTILKKNDLTAVKLHFGEKGNTAFIRPPYIRQIIQSIRKTGAIPFLTDANTLYKGARSNSADHIITAVENGFSFSSMDSTPIVIADGLRGKNETAVEVNLKNCPKVFIGSEIAACDAIVSVAHFKGHELSGFGGTLKNLGMGCASRKGKLEQHSSVSPKIKKKTCILCGECADHCPGDAIALEEECAVIYNEKCIGCGECIIRCPTESVSIRWNQTVPVFLEKMVEYTAGVLKGKQGKSVYINFISDVSPGCDCLPYNDVPIVRDIGIVASTDPVAIDQASADLVNAEPAMPGSCLKTNMGPGEDKFRGVYPEIDWEHQLDYAQKIGLGSRVYKLTRLDLLTWK